MAIQRVRTTTDVRFVSLTRSYTLRSTRTVREDDEGCLQLLRSSVQLISCALVIALVVLCVRVRACRRARVHVRYYYPPPPLYKLRPCPSYSRGGR